MYWAMISACDETNYAVQNMFSDRSREMKNLEKERLSIDSEWDEDGVMTALMQTGVVGQAPEETAKEAFDEVMTCMQEPWVLGLEKTRVPLLVDGSFCHKNWYEAK